MMNPLKILLGIIVCVSIMYSISCTEEGPSIDPDLLIGRWEIQEALRSGKPTETLSELYYEFTKDGTMKTNLTGATETGKYELNDNILMQQDTRMDTDYQIESVNDSFLVMSTVLRKLNFKFALNRVIEEE